MRNLLRRQAREVPGPARRHAPEDLTGVVRTMIPAIRGTRDILPGEVERWQFVEATARRVFERYGYAEIRTPIIEREELFAKGTGETTDIVQKEMYTFTDKGGERITLRPEATPSMVRAFVEHSLEQAMAGSEALLHRADVPLRAAAEGALPPVPPARRRGVRRRGPVDRRGGDRPGVDAGRGAGHHRRRAGHQLGRLPGVPAGVQRGARRRRSARTCAQLCGDCQRRAATNPLRIFDCKVPGGPAVIDRLPHSVDYLCEPCRAALRRRCRRTSTSSGFPTGSRTGSCAGSTTTRGRRSRSSPAEPRRAERDARRRPLRRPREAARRARPRRHRLRGRHRAARAGAAAAPGSCRRRARMSSSPRSGDRRARLSFVAAARPAARRRSTRRWTTRAASLKSQMKRADRLEAPLVFVLGDDELARGEVTVEGHGDRARRSRSRGPRRSSTCLAAPRALINGPGPLRPRMNEPLGDLDAHPHVRRAAGGRHRRAR